MDLAGTFDHFDWQTIANISTAIGVIVALLGVVLGLVLTLRSEKLTREGQVLEREQSDAAAARSEAAAALTEEYTRRVVEALETMAQKGGGPTDGLMLNPPKVKWTLAHHSGDTYMLSNIGEATANDVRVTAHETMTFFPPDPQDVGPGEALTFMAAQNLGTRDSTITVQWVETNTGDTKSWKYPLPGRPPRS